MLTNYFGNIVRHMVRAGAAIGGIFLVGIMLLVVANVLYRFFGGVIVGTYELVMLMIAVTVAFALGYTALTGTHIVIRILTSRFSQRTQVILGSFASIIGIGFWAMIAWQSVGIMLEKALVGERSIMLNVPFLPFRLAWLVGLVLFCLVFLRDLFSSVSKMVSK